jgi:DNA (cytosine-5)-methyltransferase 1
VRYLSVCSGIEAATVAWKPLGWEAVSFSEIEPYCNALLAHHYQDTPNLGDMMEIETDGLSADVLVGGTPCTSFSVAGLRKGLDDPRGQLALGFLGIADRLRPTWVVWENVPGVLSSNSGRDFGSFLGALVKCGYGFAYRILDAQYFGVPQRRRRVFVVGHLGDWRPAAAVLFERSCMSGNPAPSREPGSRVADLTSNGVGTCGADDNQGQAGHLIAFNWQSGGSKGMLSARESHTDALSSNQTPAVCCEARVRRLTPRECERLQGFPDDYTLIPYRGKLAKDGPRYRALGNSIAVPVLRWIGERIDSVAGLKTKGVENGPTC